MIGENFPYTNFHDMNMDWIIKIAKDFLDQYTHIQELISTGEEEITNLTSEGLEQLQDKADALEQLLQAWYNTHSQDIANQLADALEDLNDWYDTHSSDIASQLQNAIAAFDLHAEEKAREVIASIPADYSELTAQLKDNDFADNFDGNIIRLGNWGTATDAGMTYDCQDDGTVEITGSQTRTSMYDFYANGSTLPAWYKTNCFYRIALEGYENIQNKARLAIYSFDGNNVQTLVNDVTIGTDKIFYMPTSAQYYGLIIRLRVSDTAPSYSAVVRPFLYVVDNKFNIPSYTNNNFACSDAVELALTRYNKVHFEKGYFALERPITIPDKGKVTGDGNNTILQLKGNNAYFFEMGANVEVSSIAFDGGTENISSIGYTYGLKAWHATLDETNKPGFIHNCWFYNMGYAGIGCNYTGGYTNNGFIISECYFEHCWCGIALLSKSEYNIISNCNIRDCTYGILNDSGNNEIANCIIQANSVGLYINTSDNEGTQVNDGHGTCINCEFNHSDGLAIRVGKLNHGFNFIGCHFWFAKVRLMDCAGVSFNACTFGEAIPIIEQDGTHPVYIMNSLFYRDPRSDWYVNSNMKLVNCFTFSGTELTLN